MSRMHRLALCLCTIVVAGGASAAPRPWRERFRVDPKQLVSSGASPYVRLEPGYEMVYEGREDGQPTVLTITVTAREQVVDGVTTRVVEERETVRGEPSEVSLNFYALDPGTGDVYNFGEDVAYFKHGRISGHAGTWRSGVKGARFGLLFPGKPFKGDRFWSEQSKGVAEVREEITAIRVATQVASAKYADCVEMMETSPLEPRVKERKLFAPGVGMVMRGGLELVRRGMSPDVKRE